MLDKTNLTSQINVKDILSKCRQDCISELLFYFRNGIEFDENHIICMMIYHLISHLPRFSCAACKNQRCNMICFWNKIKEYYEGIQPISYSKEGVRCLSFCAANLSFSIWDERSILNRMSLSVTLPDSQVERIIYDEYFFAPDTLAIIDSYLPEISEIARNAIFTASKSHRVQQIVHAPKDTE